MVAYIPETGRQKVQRHSNAFTATAVQCLELIRSFMFSVLGFGV